MRYQIIALSAHRERNWSPFHRTLLHAGSHIAPGWGDVLDWQGRIQGVRSSAGYRLPHLHIDGPERAGPERTGPDYRRRVAPLHVRLPAGAVVRRPSAPNLHVRSSPLTQLLGDRFWLTLVTLQGGSRADAIPPGAPDPLTPCPVFDGKLSPPSQPKTPNFPADRLSTF